MITIKKDKDLPNTLVEALTELKPRYELQMVDDILLNNLRNELELLQAQYKPKIDFQDATLIYTFKGKDIIIHSGLKLTPDKIINIRADGELMIIPFKGDYYLVPEYGGWDIGTEPVQNPYK